MTMTYDQQSYASNQDCMHILSPDQMGYNAVADGSNLRLSWDVVSLILARAVNKGVFPLAKLVKAKSGFFSSQFTVNGVVYTKTTLIDGAYPYMDPIICFTPNLASTAPTVAPTSFAYFTQVQVSQTIAGVSASLAASAKGRAALLYAISTSVGANPSDCNIIQITPVASVAASSRRQRARGLVATTTATGNCQVAYTVAVKQVSSLVFTATLTHTFGLLIILTHPLDPPLTNPIDRRRFLALSRRRPWPPPCNHLSPQAHLWRISSRVAGRLSRRQ